MITKEMKDKVLDLAAMREVKKLTQFRAAVMEPTLDLFLTAASQIVVVGQFGSKEQLLAKLEEHFQRTEATMKEAKEDYAKQS